MVSLIFFSTEGLPFRWLPNHRSNHRAGGYSGKRDPGRAGAAGRLARRRGDLMDDRVRGMRRLPGALGSRRPALRPPDPHAAGGGGDGALLCRDCSVPAARTGWPRHGCRGGRSRWGHGRSRRGRGDGCRPGMVRGQPYRRFRLRPASLGELPAGTLVVPGLSTIVAKVADDIRVRCFVTPRPTSVGIPTGAAKAFCRATRRPARPAPRSSCRHFPLGWPSGSTRYRL